MNDLLERFRENTPRLYMVVFAVMILSAVLMFFLANAGATIGLILALGVLILSNLLVMII